MNWISKVFGNVHQMADQTGLIRIKGTIKRENETRLDSDRSPDELFDIRSFLPFCL